MAPAAESNLNATAEKDLGYGQLFAVLIRRRFWLIGTFFSVLSIATILTLITKSTYESSMRLLVESNYQGKREAGQQQTLEERFADSNVEIDNATQINLMRSSHLLQRAVDLLQTEYPTISVDKVKGVYDGLKNSLVLTQVIEKGEDNKEVSTKIFEAVYIDNDPVKTQRVLQAIQTVYQTYDREQQRLRLARGLAFIDEQLPQVRDETKRAEADLERFRKRYNLVDPGLQAEALTNALNSNRQAQRTNRIQIQEIQTGYNALQKQLALSPKDALISSRLSQSSRYQSLLNEIQKTELAIVQQRLRFTDTSPTIQKLLEQRQKQQSLLTAEMKQVLGGVSAQNNNSQVTLLAEGQLGELDLSLAGQLVEAQINLLRLKASSQSLKKAEQQLRTELQSLPSLLAEYNRLQPEVQVKRNTLEQLLRARQELNLEFAQGGFDWQVVEEPKLGEKISPSIKKNLLLGAVVGTILGCFAAFVREAVDDAIYSSDDLKQQVALPLLGIIPELPQVRVNKPISKLYLRQPQATEPTVIQASDWLPLQDALDLIHNSIQFFNSAPFKSLAVTSALAGEGKTTLALGLAMTVARLHQRVLLIDTDLRHPSLHEQLNLPNKQGLSTLLTDDASLPNQSSIQPTGSYIDVLTSGPLPSDPVKLLSSPRMKELIAEFEKSYDLVLLDTPPVLGMVDAIQAASLCSGVVLVGRIGRVTHTEVTQAVDMLSKTNMVGVIANGTSSSSNSNIPYTKQHENLPLRL